MSNHVVPSWVFWDFQKKAQNFDFFQQNWAKKWPKWPLSQTKVDSPACPNWPDWNYTGLPHLGVSRVSQEGKTAKCQNRAIIRKAQKLFTFYWCGVFGQRWQVVGIWLGLKNEVQFWKFPYVSTKNVKHLNGVGIYCFARRLVVHGVSKCAHGLFSAFRIASGHGQWVRILGNHHGSRVQGQENTCGWYLGSQNFFFNLPL